MHEEAALGARRRARALVLSVEEEAYARTRGRLFDEISVGTAER